MTKSDDQVISEFKEYVNMTPEELEKWLETDSSRNTGFSEDGGEAVGHKSGREIVDILRSDPANPSDDELAHMRRVVAYCKRHLAQEAHLKERGDSELKQTKAYKSLKNWGHDLSKN